LDEAERRMGTAGRSRKEREGAEVAAMHRDIGRESYERAKQALPVIEQEISRTFRPFLDRILALAQAKGAAPLPSYIRDSLSAISNTCYGAPIQTKAAIDAYDKLNFTQIQWKDGVTVDEYARQIVVGNTPDMLRLHDGVLSSLQREKNKVEQYMRESGWPTGPVQEPGIMTTGSLPGREPNRGITVDSDFEL
jgi:hypothetical protein